MKTVSIALIQADIIFKALHYTARSEGLDIPDDLTKVFEVVAEQNPCETHVTDTLDVMEFLSDFIRCNEPYREYFEGEIEEDMKQNILNLKVGNIYVLGDIWDGNGEIPTESYSYHLNEDQWINYEFEFLNAEDKENIENGSLVRPDALYTLVKLTAIEIL